MGDPSKTRKKYSTPKHPWQRERIEKEREIKREFGLKNKKEIWKASSELKRHTSQAKRLIGLKTRQAEKEKRDLLNRLQRFNLTTPETKIEDVLNITVKDILGRRLQTMVVKKGLARTMEQARQFIIHGHITVNNKEVNVPSYRVNRNEEITISFNPGSSLFKEDHPERAIRLDKKTEKELEEIEVANEGHQ